MLSCTLTWNTVHLSQRVFYRTRKPWLQLDILGCFAIHGKLTKGDAEAILRKQHGDILDSFDKLERKQLIRKIGSVYGRGRKQFYYKITEKGLVILFTFEPIEPIKFWKSIFGYFHHFNNEYKMTSEKVNELFLQFRNSYFRYSHYNLPVQFDTFEGVCSSWFKHLERCSRIDKKRIKIEQKIIEALAVRPKMTLSELATEIREVDSDVSKLLSNYTVDSFDPPASEELGLILRNMMDYNIVDRRFNDEFHTNFLLHNLVRVKQTDRQDKYELSLFGVLLVLNLIRYHDMNKLNNGLYYGNTFSFSRYFDLVAINYKNNLPLIFGKWKILKKVLKSFAAYNFDIIFDEQKCLDHVQRESVRRGGNREIFDGIEDIAKYSHDQLYDLAKAGQVVSFRYLTGILHEDINEYSRSYNDDYLSRNEIKVDRPDLNRLTYVYKLLMGLLLMLSPIEYLMSNQQSPELQQIATKTELLDMMEESFADKISAMYYFNLFEREFRTVVNIDKKYYSGFKSPKQSLFMILQKDSEASLKDWLTKWLTDIADLQKENYEILRP